MCSIINIVPSIKRTGLPLMLLEIAGKQRLFLIDSGSSSNLISNSLNSIAKTRFIASGTSFGYEGQKVDHDIVQTVYYFNRKKFVGIFTLTSDDTFDVFKEESNLTVEGILGVPFLINHNCILDFEKGVLMVDD